MIIDAHQHFWDLSRSDYTWLAPDSALYRNYLPTDLAPLLEQHGVEATVVVQAAASEEETRYLLQLAENYAFMAGVVGWVDFESKDAARRISALTADGHGKLKGLRPMIQDIADPDWLTSRTLDAAFESMVHHGLAFDALVRPVHFDVLRHRLAQHPSLRAVLDHAGKPDIAHDHFAVWAEGLERLAGETTIYCKLSGMLSEAGSRGPPDHLLPYIAHIFRCFGPERLLWGSDWPVLNGVGNYTQWLALSQGFVHRFAAGCESEIFRANARRFYQLELS
jgi:L-fuconolactonase